MKYFNYKDENLTSENMSIADIATEVQTPFYCYSANAFKNNFNALKNAFKEINPKICYATKSNSNLSILNLLQKEGAGADVVSVGELKKSLIAGIMPHDIVFSGVGKTSDEIEFAIINKIFQINAESTSELNTINKIAQKLGTLQQVGIRINPDVTGKTHENISTGGIGDKFGIPFSEVKNLFLNNEHFENIDISGIAFHIGSQIHDIEPFKKVFQKTGELIKEINKNKQIIKVLDIGGGFGVDYENNQKEFPIEEYAELVKNSFDTKNLTVVIEPGRSISWDTGILVTKVLYIKKHGEKKFIITDCGMNDLMRPALYDGYHKILPLAETKNTEKISTDIVGPICESTDRLFSSNEFYDVKEGDLLAILNSGAYGSSMSSNYNVRPLVDEILIDKDNYNIIRNRQSFEESIAQEIKINKN
ncbi:diaminopimelate decarboxylase [Pelagibacterales bacterium]|jgi:diaminopimelate decarboxylase|nr:diaminopimelate decarboxylase [Pelagibacterales bacterium]|tara:strand:+ start:1575 stop:2834 length:1260 start_codon:yes stop_codon:yes gene_type:complete